MSTRKNNPQAGWGCLVIILAGAFFMTLGQVLLGGSWIWPLIFGAMLVYISIKLSRDQKARQNNG